MHSRTLLATCFTVVVSRCRCPTVEVMLNMDENIDRRLIHRRHDMESISIKI